METGRSQKWYHQGPMETINQYQRDQSRGSPERQEMAWKEGLGTASHKGRGMVLMAFGDNDSNLTVDAGIVFIV